MALFRCGIFNSGGGGMDFFERVHNNNIRIWDSLNIPMTDPSEIVYYPTSNTYFMLPCSTAVSLLLGLGYTTGTSGCLKASTIRVSPYANNSGRMATHSNYTTSTAKRILLEQPCMTNDYNNTSTSYADLTNNTGDLFVSPMQIKGLSLANTHPALYSRFADMATVTLSDLFDGTDKLAVNEIFAHTNVPSGFDPDNITQGYLLYKQGSFNFILSEASDTQIYVDSNGKLNSTTAQTYQTTFFGVPSSIRSTKVDQRLYAYNSTIYGAQADTELATAMVLTTKDIYDSSNQLIMSANATLQEFKDSFNLS